MADFCIHCGAPLNGNNFCTQCGAAAFSESVVQAPVQGATVQMPAQGATAQAPTQGVATQPASKKSNLPVIIGTAAVVLVAGLIGLGLATGWFGLLHDKESAPEAVSSSTVSDGVADTGTENGASSAKELIDTASSETEETNAAADEEANVPTDEKADSSEAENEASVSVGEQSDSSQQDSAAVAESNDVVASQEQESDNATVAEAVQQQPAAPQGKTPPSFEYASASSVSTEDQIDDYRPSSAIDGNVRTAWNSAGAETGDGVGQWIELSSDELQHVTGLKILPGYCKSEEVYTKNRRPHDITISFSDGSSESFSLNDTFGEYQTLEWATPKDTMSVRITMDSTYSPTYNGRTYDDLCISEIEVF